MEENVFPMKKAQAFFEKLETLGGYGEKQTVGSSRTRL